MEVVFYFALRQDFGSHEVLNDHCLSLLKSFKSICVSFSNCLSKLK